MSAHAWLDESESIAAEDPGTYLLAAAVLPPSAIDQGRELMRRLLLRSQRKLHWHEESTKRRRLIVDAIAELESSTHLVVVRTGAQQERTERRRRKCLEQMLWLLQTYYGVEQIVAEARERKQNASDVQLLQAMRTQKRVATPLRLDHVGGPVEPLLWIADAVAGAVVASRTGEPEFLERLEATVEIHQIEA